MKKLLIVLLAGLMLCTSACAQEWFSIEELRRQLPERWQETFKTKWREVAIDAAIRLPKVAQLPVALIAGGAREPDLTPEEAGWATIEYRGPYDLLLYSSSAEYPKKVAGKRVTSPTAKGNWYSGFAPENTYVPGCDVTFGEIVEQIEKEIAKFGYDPQMFELEKPRRVWAQHLYFQGTQEDALPGHIFLEARVKVAGIPVMSHIQDAVISHYGSSRNDEFWLRPDCSACYDGYAGGLSHVYLTPLTVKETLAEDVPLCAFDKVLAQIEKEIEAGHIRKIYEIELGYVLYNEPGVYRQKTGGSSPLERKKSAVEQYQSARYYLKPMWQVNCLYVEKPTGKIRDVSDYTDDERNSIDYYQWLIDAQTGEWVEQTNAKDRCEFKGFITWESAS
ncbi:MAG: hypothetical protein IJ461_08320 [Clostridia bacterium]|nr:hypothetical protein [Clostridia bacterium]